MNVCNHVSAIVKKDIGEEEELCAQKKSCVLSKLSLEGSFLSQTLSPVLFEIFARRLLRV